jgi:hypothetical protein
MCVHIEMSSMADLEFYQRSRVSLAQLVRFLVVELIHPVLNSRFDMSVIFTANYSFS